MSTGAEFVNFVSKQLVSISDLRDGTFGYLRERSREIGSLAYGSDGTFSDTPIGLTSSGNDLFTVDHGGRLCTDGEGNILDCSACVDGLVDFMEDIEFPNVNLTAYYVALKYAERPVAAEVNPVFGSFYYTATREFIGESGDPSAVVDNGANLTFTITNLAPLATSRKAWVWLKIPQTKESTWIELCDVVWDGTHNKITTVGKLGQGATSTTAADYTVLVPGPSFGLTEFGDGYMNIGVVRGAGAGNTPSSFFVEDQTLFTVDLSTVSDALDDYADPVTVLNGETGSATNLSAIRDRTHCASFVHGGKVFVVGGSNLAAPNARVDSYSMTTGTWSSLTDLSAVREFAKAAIVGDIAYIIGGRDSIPVVVDTNFRYNAATNTHLSAGAVLPSARAAGFVGEIDGLVYYAGGINTLLADTVTLYAYDPDANAWSTLTSMPNAYSRGASAVVDGKLYVIGGYKNDALATSGGNDLLVYDPATDAWTYLNNAPGLPTEGHSAVVINGLIHVIGGRSAASSLPQRTHYVFNPKSGEWCSLPEIGGPGAFYHVLEASDGSALLTCTRSMNSYGAWSARVDLSQVISADGAGIINSTGAKTTRTGVGVVVLATFPVSLRSVPCCVANGRVYFFGGESSAGVGTQHALCFHPETKAWEILPNMPQARMWHSCVYNAADNAIYVCGGAETNGVAALGISRYDIATGSWSLAEATMDRCAYGNAVLLNDTIYAVSGGVGGTLGASPDASMSVYNLKTKSYRDMFLSDLPERYYGLVTKFDDGNGHGALIFMGGFNFIMRDTMYSFDPIEWTWRVMTETLTTAHGYASPIPIPGDPRKVLLCGGLSPNISTPVNSMKVFDLLDMSESAFGYSLTTAKFHVATAMIDGVVYAFSGSTGSAGTPVANTSCDAVYHGTWLEKTYPRVSNYSTSLIGDSAGFHVDHVVGSHSWKLDESTKFVVMGNRAT
jgi:N-acetylneuraminic acid mutarotase